MAEEGDKNTLFSPLSLSIAFAMLCWGGSQRIHVELAPQRPHLRETQEQEVRGSFLSTTAKQGLAE